MILSRREAATVIAGLRLLAGDGVRVPHHPYVAANGAAARLYAARLFPKLGAPVKTECMTLIVNGRRTHVDPKMDRSFLLLAVPREHT